MSRAGSVRRRCTTCGATAHKADDGGYRCGKQHERWRWAFTVDVSPPGAPRRQVTRTTHDDGTPFATKSEAVAALQTLQTDSRRGDHVESSKLTVGDYLTDRWLPAVEGNLRPSTARSYRSVIRLHVLPELEHVRLQGLDAATLNALYAALLSEGRKDGQDGGLSPRTVRYVHTILRKALADAERWGLVVRNVVTLADPPKAKATRAPEFTAWTADQLHSFIDHLDGHRLRALYVFMATTGVRRGEAAGLRWRDVDLDRGTATIVHTRIAVGYDVHTGTPKNGDGRGISLGTFTVEALREWRRQQLEERMAWGPAWVDSGYVFTWEDGEPIHPDRISKVFDDLVADTDLERIRLHDLRHTHATLMLADGVPIKTVSQRLGHKTIAVTVDTYGHVTADTDRDAADRFDGIISR